MGCVLLGVHACEIPFLIFSRSTLKIRITGRRDVEFSRKSFLLRITRPRNSPSQNHDLPFIIVLLFLLFPELKPTLPQHRHTSMTILSGNRLQIISLLAFQQRIPLRPSLPVDLKESLQSFGGISSTPVGRVKDIANLRKMMSAT